MSGYIYNLGLEMAMSPRCQISENFWVVAQTQKTYDRKINRREETFSTYTTSPNRKQTSFMRRNYHLVNFENRW